VTAIEFAARTDRGLVRSENQDAWFADPEAGVYGVADGMGGHQAGSIAARLTAETLPILLAKKLGHGSSRSDEEFVADIQSVFADLSTSLREESRREPRLRGMGATVVGAIVRGDRLLIVHLGDSRAYHFRDGRLSQLTRDHSLVQKLVECGAITPEQATRHPGRAQITRYLGMEGDSLPEVDLNVRLQTGDRLLLCTDGLSGMISEEAMCRVLADSPAPVDACEALVRAANEAGGQDNVTALVLNIAPA